MLRKKRVTVTEQAQAAIASGMPVDKALAEHGTVVPEAESTPPTEPVAQAPAAADPPASDPAPAAVEDPAADDGAADPNLAEAASEGVTIEAVAEDTALTSVLDRLQVAQNTVATQAAQITQLESVAEQTTATQKSLMKVAVTAINRMQIGLGGAATDLSNLSAENLLAQYQSTLTTFETRIPVGGKAEVPVDDGSHSGKVVPLVSPAVARATQIRK